MGPVEERVVDSVRQFEELIDRNLVQPPAPAAATVAR
jgi:hypothetical protein